MSLLDGLNDRQREAVQAVAGPLLILAGPGSGKTRVIVHRIAYLIEAADVHPGRVVAVTFTNRAAREMRERLEHLVGRRARALTVGTFHATCARWLRIDGHEIGLDPHFSILDANDQVDLVKDVMEDLELDPKRFAPRSILGGISAAKSKLLDPARYAREAQGLFNEKVAQVYRGYQARLERMQSLDFDDLLSTMVTLLQESTGVRERYQERYEHLLVDEFQDTNPVQYMLIRLLGARHRNVCVVGDPDQNIYSWRHAEIRNILRFQEDYPDAKVVLLEQNYRSTQTILNVASAVIAANEQRIHKGLWTDNDRGDKVILHNPFDERDEALYAVREIERRVARGGHYRDVAVMYRTNAQSRAIEDAFVRYGVPYRLVGGTRFYERREVKDVLAYLRLIANPRDTVSLQRIINVPPRGLGQKTLAELWRWAQSNSLDPYEALERLTVGDGTDHGLKPAPFQKRARDLLAEFVQLIESLAADAQTISVRELVDAVLERSGYTRALRDGTEEGEERWANIQELRAKAGDYDELEPGTGLSRFLEEVTLVQDVDNLDGQGDAATLITLHAAKGLEYPVVFIVGLEEGLSPHVRSLDSPTQLEEERRLFYVGITRAMQQLYLSHAFQRSSYGGGAMQATPSRFLEDIPEGLVHRTLGSPTRGGQPSFDLDDAPRITRRTPRPAIPERGSAEREQRPFVREQRQSLAAQVAAIPKAEQPRQPGTAPGSYKSGQKVRHPSFGYGIVVSSEKKGGDEQVTVVFEGSGVKKLSLAFAKLERV